jgi:hypothetical protein
LVNKSYGIAARPRQSLLQCNIPCSRPYWKQRSATVKLQIRSQ